jgi:hypothetical protein
VYLTSRWLVTVVSAPKPLLIVMVLHAKSFDFLCMPLRLGLKYVGHLSHCPSALGIVLVLSVGTKEGLSR